ncbi:MAG: hypothetical protein AAFO75_08885, partial [Pseudomonadota bacterium]
IAVWDDQSQRTSRVALVPFSTRVRVAPNGSGAAIMKQLTNLDPTWSGWYRRCTQGAGSGGSESGGSWQCHNYETEFLSDRRVMPCVTDRYIDHGNSYGTTDDAPGPGAWLNAHDGTRSTISADSSDTPLNNGTGATQSDPAHHWNYSSNGACADIAEVNQVVPLSADRSLLSARINGLEAYGSTAGALGTAFSWYMLSPKWKDIWPLDSEPSSYDDLEPTSGQGGPAVRKVAILMTDGVYNTYRSWKDQNQQKVSKFAEDVCTNMKDAGIEIYTVGFALDELTPNERVEAERTLRECGSDIEHFYNTLSISELQQAFRSIALKVSSQIALTD